MAKKDGLSLVERIERMELYVLKDLYSRFKREPVKWFPELEDYLGPWTGQPIRFIGRLGALYLERELEFLDLNSQIVFLQQEEVTIYTLVVRARNSGSEDLEVLRSHLRNVRQMVDDLKEQALIERLLATTAPVAVSTNGQVQDLFTIDRKPPQKNPSRRYVAKGERKKSVEPKRKKKDANANKKNRKHRAAA